MTNKEIIYQIVKSIPSGKVATYGQIAQLTGIKSPRVVGNILHHNPDPEGTPCYKVVNSKGRVADNFGGQAKLGNGRAKLGGGKQVQIAKLAADGIAFVKHDYVDLTKHLWRPKSTQ